MTNPLLDSTGLPAFARIRPEHIEPAIDVCLADCRAEIERLTREVSVPTWESFVEPLDEVDDCLSRAWSPVGHLNWGAQQRRAACAYNACLPKLSDYGTEIGQNERLYSAPIRPWRPQEHLNPVQRKCWRTPSSDFHLSGVDLPPTRRRASRRSASASRRLTSRYLRQPAGRHPRLEQADRRRVPSGRAARIGPRPGTPDRRAARRERGGSSPWTCLPTCRCMTYADDRELRASSTRPTPPAPRRGPHAGQWDNGPVMERILALRHELAGLLGFRQLCGALPGPQDGPLAGGGAGFLTTWR
jgi:oligopeptidase A